MQPYFSSIYGNPSEFHVLGRKAKIALEKARKNIAVFFGVKPAEIIFTGSATESINLSHKGLIEAVGAEFPGQQRPHLVTSAIEHSAVLETCKHLERLKIAAVTYLPVDRHGLVSLNSIKKAVRPQTVLVSIIYVNNEVGTIQPIAKIGAWIKQLNRRGRQHRLYFHTDATQAIQYLPCRINNLEVDLLSLTGHKFGAPKGIGALVFKGDTPLVRQLDGGSQESGYRAGTENIPYIIGLSKALTIVQRNKIKTSKRLWSLNQILAQRLKKIPGVLLTGHPRQRSPHIVSCVVKGVEGEALVLRLSDLGVIVSSGSACTSARLAPSHVLTAMGIPPELSHGSLRFSLSKQTSLPDIDYTVNKLSQIVRQLRQMAPSWE
jgi:cysteine desulfurase